MTLLSSWFRCSSWQQLYCNSSNSCCCRSPLTISSSEWPMDHIEDVVTPAEAGAAMMDPLAEATGAVGAVVGPRECHTAPHQWMHPPTSWLPTSVTVTSHVMQHAHNVWPLMALRKGRAGVLLLAGGMPGGAVHTEEGVAEPPAPLKKSQPPKQVGRRLHQASCLFAVAPKVTSCLRAMTVMPDLMYVLRVYSCMCSCTIL